jgi:hypothetical protein
MLALLVLTMAATGAVQQCPYGISFQPGHRIERTAMGVELYSWRSGGSFRFALLVGTNRSKAAQDIKSPACTLPDATTVGEALSHLAVGERVVWAQVTGGGEGGFEYPPVDVVDAIKSRCQHAGVLLTIARPPE